MAEQSSKPQPVEPAEPKRSAKKALHVSAVMVTAKTTNDRIVYLYRGDVVGDEITPESVEHLQSLGFVTDDDVAPVE